MLPMTKRTDAVPATTGDASSAPATASEGALPTVSGTGPGEWNDALVAGVVQVCAGSDLGDKRAIGKARAGIAALTGIGPDDVIGDMVAAQLVSAHHAAMDCSKGRLYDQATVSASSFRGRQEGRMLCGE